MERYMRYMKYLVANENIYLFTQNMQHRDFAARLDIYPTSGGIVMLIDGKLKCCGEAFSLNLCADVKNDTALLNQNIDNDM
jgi:hypothetical protein